MSKKNNKFSIEKRYNYHLSRDRNSAKYGIKFGGTKQSYSMGYVDAFHNVNNSSAVKRDFGKKSFASYLLGLIRGRKAAKAFTQKTGKPSFTIEY